MRTMLALALLAASALAQVSGVVGTGGLVGNAGMGTAAGGYSYQRTVVIQGSQVATTNNTTAPNVTALVCFNGSGICNASVPGLNQSGAGAHVLNASGYDIVFSSTGCLSPTLLNWELIDYTASTGALSAWVSVGTLTHNVNLTIYMCYGNAAISTFQGGAAGSAWHSSYKAVWHLAGGSGSDSTSNANTLTATSVTTSGTAQIPYAAGAAVFNGTSSKMVNASDAALPGGTTDRTTCAWAYNSSGGVGAWLWYGLSGSGDHIWFMGSFASAPPNVELVVDGITGIAGTTYFASTWTWQCATLSSSGTSELVVLNNTNTTSGSVTVNTTTAGAAVHVGNSLRNSGSDFDFWSGNLQEIIITNTAWTRDQMATYYANTTSPSTFYTVGSETGPS